MNAAAAAPISRRASRTVRTARCVVALLWLNGCHTWQPQTLRSPPDFGANTRVRVARKDGSSVVLVSPSIVADSLVGPRAGSWDRAAIAVSDIEHAEALRTSATRTTLAVLGIIALVAGTVIVIAGATLALSAPPAY